MRPALFFSSDSPVHFYFLLLLLFISLYLSLSSFRQYRDAHSHNEAVLSTYRTFVKFFTHGPEQGMALGDVFVAAGFLADREDVFLLHRNEILKLIGKTVEKGMTLVPVRMYFKKGRVKVAISLAKGKKEYDKRETIKRREVDRETRAAVKERQR